MTEPDIGGSDCLPFLHRALRRVKFRAYPEMARSPVLIMVNISSCRLTGGHGVRSRDGTIGGARVGIAWRLDDKTVVTGGYGIVYDDVMGIEHTDPRQLQLGLHLSFLFARTSQ